MDTSKSNQTKKKRYKEKEEENDECGKREGHAGGKKGEDVQVGNKYVDKRHTLRAHPCDEGIGLDHSRDHPQAWDHPQACT
jgi:hypothetical protein